MNHLTPQQIEQLQAFSNCFITYPAIQEIFNDFDELRFNRNFQSDQQCMLITGDTGVGKSHLINEYKKRTLASQDYGREAMPILISRISSGKGFDATLTQMLVDLDHFGGYQFTKRGYRTDLRKKLVDNLIKAQVELLIINEFQELIEFKTGIERQHIANGLKYISEEAKVPIVLVGMPWAEQIAEEPQWSSRLVRRRKLEYFSLQKDIKLFRQYLMSLAKNMPFERPPKLEDKRFAIPLFAACKGENRALKHLLIESLKVAMSNGDSTLEIHHISAAYDSTFLNKNINKPQQHINPFTLPLDKVLISEIVMPSRYNPNAINPEDRLITREFSEPKALSKI
ncbi:MAG: TniB family NTP-binding protein [Gammaproteobacteria bacterium]|nr:TniB family NTP-binding protein [Gammaproteobacteria bacterium]MBU2183894.1 TniB family NTP-binding protein [Gammaproteobacteria bacterium]MBU2203065.1 TniB family NTP-binding protein [Gammaproteobacteria bacterium]